MSYIDDEGWHYTCHPMPPEDTPAKFARDMREAYEEKGHIVKDVLAYIKHSHDPLTCPYFMVIDGSWRNEAEYGMEVIWKPSE